MENPLQHLREKFADQAYLRFQCIDVQVREAFLDAPRHLFAPEGYQLQEIDSDCILKQEWDKQGIKTGMSTRSLPGLVALTFQGLNIGPSKLPSLNEWRTE